MKAYTTGLPTSTRTTTDTIPPTKATVSLMHSLPRGHNGTIPMTMVTVTTPHLLINPMNVQTLQETALRIGMDAQTQTVTVGPTLTTGNRPTKSNGSMPITTDTATTTSMKSIRIKFTSTSVVMHSRTMRPNGTIPTATDTATTTRTYRGMNTEHQSGPVKSSLVHKTSTSSLSIAPSGETRMGTGLAMSK